jgi:very-short-patch-repair endonuclease
MITDQEFAVLKARVTSYRIGGKQPQTGLDEAIVTQDKKTPTDAAKRLLRALQEAGIEGPWYREFTFHEERNWKLDVAMPSRKLSVEIDGGVHRIKGKFLRDMERHNALIISGWKYIRVTPAQVENGEALVLVRALVQQKGE